MFDERSHQMGHSEFNLQDVKDRNVIDRRGDNVGRVVDVVIDPVTWRVSHFLLRLRRDLEPEITGRQRALFETGADHLFEVDAHRIRSVGDNVILDVELSTILDRLRTAEGQTPRSSYAGQAESDRLRYGRPEVVRPETAPTQMGTMSDDLPPMP